LARGSGTEIAWQEAQLRLSKMAPFPFVTHDHPFFAKMEIFRTEIARREQSVGRGEATCPPPAVHAETKALRDRDGSWRLDRFYWSIQHADDASPGGLHAATLYYAAKAEAMGWHRFPADPRLATLPFFFAEPRVADTRVDVLRYVPLRRVTFRRVDANGAVSIGKIRRPSRVEEGYRRLSSVAEAVSRAGGRFKVAAPLSLDRDRCCYFQEALAGENVADLIHVGNAAEMFGEIGTLHRAIHTLSVADVPSRGNADWLLAATDDLELVRLYDPRAAARLDHVPTLLRRAFPAPEPAAFCHGDFVCSQMLVVGPEWSVTDFDLCHGGDPCRDIAMFLASLAFDVPSLQSGAHPSASARTLETGCAAYLDAYQRAAGRRVDPRRLLWHRVCAELYYLALALKKNRYDPADFERRVKTCISLAAELDRGRRSTGLAAPLGPTSVQAARVAR